MSAHSERLLHEKELVVGAGSGRGTSFSRVHRSDPDAVTRALHHDYPGLVAMLVRRVGDAGLAHDVLHDAVVTALEKLEAGAPVPPEVLAGFVFRTAINHWRNHRRGDRRHPVDADAIDALQADADAEPSEQSHEARLRELVRRLIQGLSSRRDREMLVRFYLDEEDKSQICESFSLSGAQFDRVIYRARDRLRVLVERSGFSRRDLLGLALLVALLTSERWLGTMMGVAS